MLTLEPFNVASIFSMIFLSRFAGAEIRRAPSAAPPMIRNSANCMSTRKGPPSRAKPPSTATRTTAAPMITNMFVPLQLLSVKSILDTRSVCLEMFLHRSPIYFRKVHPAHPQNMELPGNSVIGNRVEYFTGPLGSRQQTCALIRSDSVLPRPRACMSFILLELTQVIYYV